MNHPGSARAPYSRRAVAMMCRSSRRLAVIPFRATEMAIAIALFAGLALALLLVYELRRSSHLRAQRILAAGLLVAAGVYVAFVLLARGSGGELLLEVL